MSDDQNTDPAAAAKNVVAPAPPAVEVEAPSEPTVTLSVDRPFYYSSVVLPDGEDGTLVIERTGTQVAASDADELVSAAASLGVTLSRSE